MYTDEQEHDLFDIGHHAEYYKMVWEDALDCGDTKLRDVAYKIYESYCELYEKMCEYYYNLNCH